MRKVILSITGLLIASLLMLIAWYTLAVDWSSNHTAAVSALPLASPVSQPGTYRVRANALEFRVRIAGPVDSTHKVLLLHGFPESSIKWQGLMEDLAQEKIRVAAFDQRGYSPGARPDEVNEYQIEYLVNDVFAVADALGFEQFHLLGHDWGAVVGWMAVLKHAPRIRSWTAMAIPHPQAFFADIVGGGEQAARSEYFDTLRMPLLPEMLGQIRLKSSLAHLTDKRRNEYLSIFSEPGALSAVINWYRAMDIPAMLEQLRGYPPISTPTVFIGGRKDELVAPGVIDDQQALMTGPFDVHMLDTGHGIIEEQRSTVTAFILENIRR